MLKKLFTAIFILSLLSLAACKEVPYKTKELTQEQAVAERPNIIISDEEKTFISAVLETEEVKEALESEEGGKEFTQEESEAIFTEKLPYDYELITFYAYGDSIVFGAQVGEEEIYLQLSIEEDIYYKSIGLKDEKGKSTDYYVNENNEKFEKSYRQKF